MNPTRRQIMAAIGAAAGVQVTGSVAPNDRPDQVAANDGTLSRHMTRPTATIWNEDGLIRADGPSGPIEGTNAARVIQRTLDTLPEGASWPRSVCIAGSFSVDRKIGLPSRVVLDLTNATLRAAGDDHVLTVEHVSDVTVAGGVLDGEGQSDAADYLGVISTDEVERMTIVGTEVRNGGYYGVNLFEANDCLLWGVYAHDNYRHGIHPGSNKEGWGRANKVVQCRAENNGVDGINDRGSRSGGQALYNQYVNCVARNNGQNGFHLSDDSPADSDQWATHQLVGCQAIGNGERGYRVGSANASLIRPVADGNKIGVLVDGSPHTSIVEPYVTDFGSSDAVGIELENLDANPPHSVLVVGGVVRTDGQNLLIDGGDGSEAVTIRDVDVAGGEGDQVEHSTDPTALTVENVAGYRTSDGGLEYQDGDGETVWFDWSHGLAETPTSISVTPGNEDTAGEYYVDADESTVQVGYDQPPPEGSDNLKWWWDVGVY